MSDLDVLPPEGPAKAEIGAPARTTDPIGRLSVWLMAGLLGGFLVIGNLQPVGEWKLTHWWFSYELGFVKRGLLGTLAAPLRQYMGHTIAALVGSGLILAVSVGTLVAIVASFVGRFRRESLAWCLGAACLAMPGSVSSLARDFGRYDGLLLVVGIVTCAAIWRAAARSSLLLWAMVPMQCVAVLIHEIYIVSVGPLVLGFGLLRWKEMNGASRAALMLAGLAAIATTAVVGEGGKVQDRSAEQLIDQARGDLGFEPSTAAMEILTRSLTDNVAYSMAHWSSLEGGVVLAALLMGLAPALVILSIVLERFTTREAAVVWVGFLSPLLLAAVGIDVGRWGMFGTINAFLLSMAVYASTDDARRREWVLRPSETFSCVAAMVLGAGLGGLSPSHAAIPLEALSAMLDALGV